MKIALMIMPFLILALFLWILRSHKLIKVIILVIMASLLVWGGWRWWQSRPEEKDTADGKGSNSYVVTRTRYTRLVIDQLTPVADSINYEYELDTQGDSVAITRPTIMGDTTITYNGHGELQLPFGVRTRGLVHITSLNPNKQVRVRIWRVEYR